jgi:hypothetical protein
LRQKKWSHNVSPRRFTARNLETVLSCRVRKSVLETIGLRTNYYCW